MVLNQKLVSRKSNKKNKLNKYRLKMKTNKLTKKKNMKGGQEYTQENKQLLNKEKENKISELEKKTQTAMSAKEYQDYTKQLNELSSKSADPRDKLDYEYMFSPLLTQQMKDDAKKVQGKFFVGVNLMKLYGSLKDIFSKKPVSNEELNTFKELGEWVNQHKNYEKTLEDVMGYRNDSDLVLKPESELRNNATFREVITVSKKYSGIQKLGKVTPNGLLKLIRILDKYKRNENQWLRVATVLEIIYKYLSGGEPRESYFKSNKELPLHILFELEEFYSTEHMFMSREEILKFKENLEFYRNV